jgi:hypothetical protein
LFLGEGRVPDKGVDEAMEAPAAALKECGIG